MIFTIEKGDKFAATGVDCSGKRFKIVSSNWFHIAGINIWRGSRWLIRDNKRKLIERVFN